MSINGWSYLGLGIHAYGALDLQATVTGSRGNWAWLVTERKPPTFTGRTIDEGTEPTKSAAMQAAQAAIATTKGV